MIHHTRAQLSRRDTAAALTAAGWPISASTLAKKASKGEGPPYHIFGRCALYLWADALTWAQSAMVANGSNTYSPNPLNSSCALPAQKRNGQSTD